MKDQRFIELLNLYVDQQIAADEASELEAEVMRNPARRRTYEDYCRLQRGCSLLGEHERSQAPASLGFARSLRDAERKIAIPSPRPSFWRGAYAGTFAATAMAACVAVIIVNRQSSEPSAGSVALLPIATQNPAVPGAIAANHPMAGSGAKAAPVPVETFELQPVFAATNLGVIHNAREAEIAANDRTALEWMQRVDSLQTNRPVVDDQAFEARAVLQPDNRVFRGRHAVQGNAEFTAFQFQR